MGEQRIIMNENKLSDLWILASDDPEVSLSWYTSAEKLLAMLPTVCI